MANNHSGHTRLHSFSVSARLKTVCWYSSTSFWSLLVMLCCGRKHMLKLPPPLIAFVCILSYLSSIPFVQMSFMDDPLICRMTSGTTFSLTCSLPSICLSKRHFTTLHFTGSFLTNLLSRLTRVMWYHDCNDSCWLPHPSLVRHPAPYSHLCISFFYHWPCQSAKVAQLGVIKICK